MKNLGKLWTGAVAYVSLLVGAGLSVAGNLADTDRVRGDAVDAVDIVLAVGPPLATLLVAELFVSEWPRRLSVQSVRWVTTAVVGSLATVVSWLHIHELLVSRGQLALVSVLWPIAIDGLAIMAMAKLLVVRMSHVQPDTAGTLDTPLSDALAAAQLSTALSTVPGQDKPLSYVTAADTYTDTEMMSWTARDTDTARDIVSTVPLTVDTDIDVPLTVDTAEGYLSRLSRDMDTTTVPAAPVSGPPAVQGHGTRSFRQRGTEDALDVAVAAILLDRDLTPADKARLATDHGVTTKTVGRRAAALKPAEEE